MQRIPEITTDNPLVVVEELRARPAWLRLLGAAPWVVCWRWANAPCTQTVTPLPEGATRGSAELAGVRFGFAVRWRRDLRRRPGYRPLATLLEEAVVTPGSVLQLSEYRARRD